MCFRLAIHPARKDRRTTSIAEHVDPDSLKRTGYDLARSLGDADAIWQISGLSGDRLELRCRSGHTLVIAPVDR
jgi:hypothetical protein